MTQNPLPPLIDLAYAAMDDAARWRDFLAAFAAALDAAQSTLSIQYTNHPEISITAYGGPKGTDEVHREYLAKWAASDPWVSSKEMRSVGEGKIICSQQLCPDEVLEQGIGVRGSVSYTLLPRIPANAFVHIGLTHAGNGGPWQPPPPPRTRVGSRSQLAANIPVSSASPLRRPRRAPPDGAAVPTPDEESQSQRVPGPFPTLFQK